MRLMCRRSIDINFYEFDSKFWYHESKIIREKYVIQWYHILLLSSHNYIWKEILFAFCLTFNFVLISFKQWKIINTLNKLLFFVLYFFRLISFKLWKIINTSESYFSLYDIFFRFIYFKLWKIINTLNKIHFFLLIFFPNSVKTKQIKL